MFYTHNLQNIVHMQNYCKYIYITHTESTRMSGQLLWLDQLLWWIHMMLPGAGNLLKGWKTELHWPGSFWSCTSLRENTEAAGRGERSLESMKRNLLCVASNLLPFNLEVLIWHANQPDKCYDKFVLLGPKVCKTFKLDFLVSLYYFPFYILTFDTLQWCPQNVVTGMARWSDWISRILLCCCTIFWSFGFW